MDQGELREKVRQAFTDYMVANGQRKTPERYAILDAIYSMDGYFGADELYRAMLEKEKFRVSMATLYNTLNLLLDAHLVIRHQFGSKTAYYEPCFGIPAHHYLVCTVCGQISPFRDKAVEDAIGAVKTKRFRANSSVLYLYGVCSKCAAALKRKQKKQHNKNV